MSNMEQIEVIVAEAMKCGMSYGEFVAKKSELCSKIIADCGNQEEKRSEAA